MTPEGEAFLENLPKSEVYECAYFADRLAQRQQFLWPKEQGHMPGALYQELMDRHFRRSGRLFYRQRCPGCTDCIPIRIAVGDFSPSKSQRRVLRKNADVEVKIGPPILDDARFHLYSRYNLARHDKAPEREDLQEFLYDSPTDTLEVSYWLRGELIACGICDVTPIAVSTVYFFFDPDESRRSLGVFSVLKEIELARRDGRDYYYIGFWVPGCRKMEYKAQLGPHELLFDAWQAALSRKL